MRQGDSYKSVLEAGDLVVITRRLLLGIKQRAERWWRERQAAGPRNGADHRRPPPGRHRRWGPRLVVAVVVVAYAAELVREATVGLFPFEALPLQLALASSIALLLLLAATVLQQETLLGGMTRCVRRLVFCVPRIALLALGRPSR